MTLLQILCKLIERIKFTSLNEVVIEQAKLHIIDAFGTGLFGSTTGLFQKIWPLFQGETESYDEATLFGNGIKVSVENAAFLNSVSINESNFEDGHRIAACHPASSVIPASIAVAERKGIDGEKLITSIVVGYETVCRIGMAINPSHLQRGFHTTSTMAPLGSAASVGKLLDLDRSVMVSALGLAASFSSGLMESFHTDARPLQVGRGCQSGILAVTLAQRGVSGSALSIEGKEGFLSAFCDKFDIEKITSVNVIAKYEIENSYIKLHGGCRHLHAPIDAAMMLKEKHQIIVNDIDTITVETYPVALDFVGIMEPKTGKEGEFSLPFAISIAVSEGKVDPWKFTDQKVCEDSIKNFMKKVKVIVNDQLAESYPHKRGTVVTIVTKKGKFLQKLDHAKGEPEFPASKSEVDEKFKSLARKVLPLKKVNKILEVIRKLERVKDVRELTELFSKGKK
jgi:2-methylcitrate dehydratase PrpD